MPISGVKTEVYIAMLNRKILFLLFLAIACSLVWLFLFSALADNILEVVFFDVGQGDAIFIETGAGRQVLIDGGPDNQILAKLNKQMPFWDRYIDLLVLTHPDADHLVGLVGVLEYFQVGHILISGAEKNTAAYRRWREIIQQKGIPVSLADFGQEIVIGQGITIKVLWPEQDLASQYSNNSNNLSVVLKLVYHEAEFLFAGDIEKQAEGWLVKEAADLLPADLLKVAHHGSKSSSIGAFVKAVAPKIAVISVGKDNYYRHPSQEVLDRFKDAVLLRTDRHGDIRAETDGQEIWLKLEKKL